MSEDTEAANLMSRGTGDNDPVPNRVPSDQHPTEMIARQIDCTLTNGELTFHYSKTWKPRPVDAATLAKYLTALAKGQIPTDFEEAQMKVEQQCPSKLSIRNHTSRYLVFYLGDSLKNWQFAQLGPAITVGKGLANTAFYEGWRVDPAGNSMPVGPKFLDGCRVAYIAALVDTTAGVPHYAHAFNLNVDLFYADNTVTPIVIDPDTRYPGGNTIDGEP